jgi:hypothetical protein
MSSHNAVAVFSFFGSRLTLHSPPLKSATVFGGIARVVHSADPGDSEEMGHMPSINTKSREIADMQDIYRRTLAASWTSRACDLPADKLVEELFAGSSCWTSNTHNSPDLSGSEQGSPFLSVDSAVKETRSGKKLSPSFERRPKSSSSNHSHGSSKTSDAISSLGRHQNGGSLEQQLYDEAKGRGWKSRNADSERCEFDVREDLRSWEVTANGS